LATLTQLLDAAGCQLPNVQAAELLGLGSRAMAAAVPLLLKQPRLWQLKISGRGGPLHYSLGALQAASVATVTAAGNSTTQTFAAQHVPTLPVLVGNGCSFTNLTHLTLKRLNLFGDQMCNRSGRPPDNPGASLADRCKAFPLLLQQLRQLSSLPLQQVVMGPRDLTVLAGVSATLQDLSLCRLQQMRLQLSP
jgi:hypothetical protein